MLENFQNLILLIYYLTKMEDLTIIMPIIGPFWIHIWNLLSSVKVHESHLKVDTYLDFVNYAQQPITSYAYSS
jgi:hypothetical protein